MSGYNALDPLSQTRNISAWTPVVAQVLQGFTSFPDAAFEKYLPQLYPMAVEVMSRDMAADVRVSVQVVFKRAERFLVYGVRVE